MSKKEATLATEALPDERVLVRAFLNVGTQGDAGKSTFKSAQKEVFDFYKVPNSSYLLDSTGQTFYKIHGERDSKGDLIAGAVQNPVKGVRTIDLVDKNDREKLIDILDTSISGTNNLLIDGRAGILDLLNDVMGDIDSLIMTFEEFQVLPVLEIIIKDEKSMEGVEKLYDALQDTTSPYQIVFIMNKGMWQNEELVVDAYNNSKSVQFFKARKNTRELIFRTQFSSSVQQAFKEKKIVDVANNGGGFVKAKASAFLRELQSQFKPLMLESYAQAYGEV